MRVLGKASFLVLILSLGACVQVEGDSDIALRASPSPPTDPDDVAIAWQPALTLTCAGGQKQRKLAYRHEYESNGSVFDCTHTESVLTVCRPYVVPETGTQWEVVQRTWLSTTCEDPVYWDITTSCVKKPDWCFLQREGDPELGWTETYCSWHEPAEPVTLTSSADDGDTDEPPPDPPLQQPKYAWNILQSCRAEL